jgi:L-methionine (R)-S-oxide reductase
MANETDEWLSNLVKHVGAVAGTVHLRDGDGLRLMSAVNIPDVVKKAVEYVPNGKGMAGIALHSGQPVQTCNLKDDNSGNVRPGAKAVNAKAAVAMPIRDGNGHIVAVVGVAFNDERELPEQEIKDLMDAAMPVVGLVEPRNT